MRKPIMFLLILFFGLISNSKNIQEKLEEYEKENREVLIKIENLYTNILTHPSLTEEEKEFIRIFQRRWKNHYEKEISDYKMNIYSDKIQGMILEEKVLNFKNKVGKKRMEVLANVYHELESRL